MVGRRVTAVSIARDVVERENETIVDVADAKHGLINLVGVEIVADTGGSHPVGGDLEGCGGEDALTLGEKSELRLGGIVAVEQRNHPTVVVGPALRFKAADRESRFVEA